MRYGRIVLHANTYILVPFRTLSVAWCMPQLYCICFTFSYMLCASVTQLHGVLLQCVSHLHGVCINVHCIDYVNPSTTCVLTSHTIRTVTNATPKMLHVKCIYNSLEALHNDFHIIKSLILQINK